MSEASPQQNIHTEEDYYHLPENIHAELIDGQFYLIPEIESVRKESVRKKAEELQNLYFSPAFFCLLLYDQPLKAITVPNCSLTWRKVCGEFFSFSSLSLWNYIF